MCPTAYITQESLNWVDEFNHIQDAREATGAGYFPSVATADARVVQVLVILQQEKGYADAEVKNAINRG